MADATLASARNENESLEKSLQALRGKLIGLKKDKPSKNPHFPLKTTAKINRSIHNGKSARNNLEDQTQINSRPGVSVAETKLLYNGEKSDKRVVRPSELGAYHAEKPAKFEKLASINGNYFDDFRKKVNEIQKSKNDFESSNYDNSPERLKNKVMERKFNEFEKWKPGEARQFLLNKIEHQTNCIEDLEKKVREMKLENQKMHETQQELQDELRFAEADKKTQEHNHRQALLTAEARAGLKYAHEDEKITHAASVDRDQANRERQIRVETETQLEVSRMKNVELRQRVNEIAERANLLHSIHQERVRALESKLKASMDVARYYCEFSGISWQDQPDDSTEEILFGASENTTLNLLRTFPGFQSVGNVTGKKSLRSYFLAVLFAVRVKNEAMSNNLWKPYLALGGVHGSGVEVNEAS